MWHPITHERAKEEFVATLVLTLLGLGVVALAWWLLG